jgi:hypothetical protein
VQYVHQITETNRSPEALAFGVEARDPNLAALDAPLFHPGECALDQPATHAPAALVRAYHQIGDLGPPDFQLDRGSAVDPDGAKAQQGTIALADEDRRLGVAEGRSEQAVDLRFRVGAQGKERVSGRVMLAERNPERRDPIEVARVRAANAPAVSLRGRGLQQLAS